MILQSLFNRAAFLASLILALGAPSNILLAAGGGTYYVDAVNGSDANDGSSEAPWKSITYGIAQNEVDSLSVASGLYDNTSNGEVFPLVIPNRDFTLEGPGDGSAILRWDLPPAASMGAPVYLSVVDPDTLSPGSPGSPTDKTISGLRFELPTSTEELGNEWGFVGIFLGGLHGEVHITNNEIVGGGTAVVGDYVGIHSDEETLILVHDNVISGQEINGVFLRNQDCIYGVDAFLGFGVWGNHVSGTGDDGIDIQYVTTTAEGVTGAFGIENNTIVGAGEDGIDVGVYHDTSLVGDPDVNVVGGIGGNTITGSSSDGIEYTFSNRVGGTAEIALWIEGNTITGSESDNIDIDVDCSGDSAANDIELYVLDNDSTSGSDGVDIRIWGARAGYSVVNADVVIQGNSLTGNESAGVDFQYSVYSDAVHADMYLNCLIANNSLTGNEGGITLDKMNAQPTWSSSWQGTMVFDLDVTENTITGNSVDGVYMFGSETSTLAGVFDLTFNNNTISGNSGSAEGTTTSTSSSTLYEFELSGFPAAVYPTVVATDNFWGTQDNAAIAERVWDGVDDPYLALVDHSSPRPDTLGFTVEVFSGSAEGEPAAVEMAITASGDGTYFVPYAGTSTPIQVTIDGAPVSPDDMDVDGTSILLYEVLGGLSGEVEVCVTNPGGQTGCAQVDVVGGPNTAPWAIYDAVETPLETPVTIVVVANDFDAEDNLDPTTVVITQTPHKGTVVNNGDGTVTYTPNPGPLTTDTFNYTVSDTGGLVSNVATVEVRTVADGSGGGGDNSAPAAHYDTATTAPETAVMIDVVANDTDVDGNLDPSTVTITQTPHKGTVSVNVDGTVVYTPSAGTSATTDTFNYTVQDTDGATSNVATVEVTITPEGDDSNLGGSGPPLRRDLGPPTTVPGS
jgi:hypothetical protein